MSFIPKYIIFCVGKVRFWHFGRLGEIATIDWSFLVFCVSSSMTLVRDSRL